jgi:hypothetical protein
VTGRVMAHPLVEAGQNGRRQLQAGGVLQPTSLQSAAGPCPGTKTKRVCDAWAIVFSPYILDEIMKSANAERRRVSAAKKQVWRAITTSGLNPLFGIVMRAGIGNWRCVSVRELFLRQCCNPFCGANVADVRQ